MARPPPLKPVPSATYFSPNLQLASSDADGLTPRTPHNKKTSDEDELLDEIDFLATPGNDPDRQRLLSSSERAGVGLYPPSISRTSRNTTWRGVKPTLPIVLSCIFGVMILVLTGIAVFAPEVLDNHLKPLEVPDASAVVSNPPETSSQPPSTHTGPIIDYSKYKSFPLTPLQYAEECWVQFKTMKSHGGFWSIPHNGGVADVEMHTNDKRVCKSSITYLLDGTDSGLIAELSVLAQIAAMARERGRAFFVDDRNWTHGKWKDYFEDVHSGQAPTGAGCRPPPPEELVACPRLARHWVVTFRTAKFHFGHDFYDQYEDAHAVGIQRQRPIYEASRKSLTSTIRPHSQLQALISRTRNELFNPHYSHYNPSKPTPPSHSGPLPYVSVHIRRGDSKPQSGRYSQKGQPIPISDYVSAVSKAIGDFVPSNYATDNSTRVFVASDSSHALGEFQAAIPMDARWHVVSLTTSNNRDSHALAYASPEAHVMPAASTAGNLRPGGYVQSDWTGGLWTPEARVRYTKGMLVDLALLSGLWLEKDPKSPTSSLAPSAVVCGITSTICTTMALGLGFDRAFDSEKGLRWMEIDGNGGVEPVWQAYRLNF